MVEQTHPGNARYVAPARSSVTTLTARRATPGSAGGSCCCSWRASSFRGSSSIAGSQLSPYRIVLLPLSWLLWRWLTTRPCLVDLLVLASAVWTVLGARHEPRGRRWGRGRRSPSWSTSAATWSGGSHHLDAREYKRYFVILGRPSRSWPPFAVLEMLRPAST